MNVKKERKAFVSQISVSLDRILLIQNGIADQYSQLFGQYRQNNVDKKVMNHNLNEAKQHLENIKISHSLIKGMLEKTT